MGLMAKIMQLDTDTEFPVSVLKKQDLLIASKRFSIENLSHFYIHTKDTDILSKSKYIFKHTYVMYNIYVCSKSQLNYGTLAKNKKK